LYNISHSFTVISDIEFINFRIFGNLYLRLWSNNRESLSSVGLCSRSETTFKFRKIPEKGQNFRDQFQIFGFSEISLDDSAAFSESLWPALDSTRGLWLLKNSGKFLKYIRISGVGFWIFGFFLKNYGNFFVNYLNSYFQYLSLKRRKYFYEFTFSVIRS
jgi:hypothetical protein